MESRSVSVSIPIRLPRGTSSTAFLVENRSCICEFASVTTREQAITTAASHFPGETTYSLIVELIGYAARSCAFTEGLKGVKGDGVDFDANDFMTWR